MTIGAMPSAPAVVVFLVSGTAGATASANIAGDFITSAASGPIFGLIGGEAALVFGGRESGGTQEHAADALPAWIGITLARPEHSYRAYQISCSARARESRVCALHVRVGAGGTCAALLLHWRLFRHLLLSWVVLALVLALNLYMGEPMGSSMAWGWGSGAGVCQDGGG